MQMLPSSSTMRTAGEASMKIRSELFTASVSAIIFPDKPLNASLSDFKGKSFEGKFKTPAQQLLNSYKDM